MNRQEPPRPSDEAQSALSRLPSWCLPAAIGVTGAVTLLVIWLVASHRWQIGIAGEWTWAYYDPRMRAPLLMLVAPLLCAAVIVAAACYAVVRGLQTRSATLALLAAVLGGALGLTFTLPDAGPLGGMDAVPITVNPYAGGYYVEAVRIQDLSGYLRDYPEHIARLEVKGPLGHISDHPAGPVLFHALVDRVMEASPALTRLFLPGDEQVKAVARDMAQRMSGAPISDGALAGIWASAFLFRIALWLTLIPVYLLGRELHSREAGLLGAALTAFVPALHLFGPYPDQVFPFILVFSLYAWVMGARRRSILWAALSALTLFIGLQFSLSLMAAGACMAVASLLMLREEMARPGGALDWRKWAIATGVWAATFAAAILIVRLLFGYDVVRVWTLCLSRHASFAEAFPRSRWLWTAFNPLEFAVFCGLPAFVMLALAACGELAGRLRGRAGAFSVLVWTAPVVIAALDLSGRNLGEVARLWMMLMPLCALGAAGALAGLGRGKGWTAGIVLALSFAQLAVFKLHLDVFMAGGM